MAQLSTFTGFTADGYRFLMELEFNNEKAFVDANRQRYYDGVRDPMRALAMELSQTALDIDPLFNTNLMGVVLSNFRHISAKQSSTSAATLSASSFPLPNYV